MTDISLGDVAADTAKETAKDAATDAATEKAAEAASSGGADTAQWFMELVDRMDQKGYLGPMLFGPEGMDQMGGSAPQQAPAETAATGGGSSDGMDLSAESIAEFGPLVIDKLGDRKISEIVQLCRSHPDRVNQLIESELGGETTPDEGENDG